MASPVRNPIRLSEHICGSCALNNRENMKYQPPKSGSRGVVA
jgi:hypothetical protein